jgi:hypothetical protein
VAAPQQRRARATHLCRRPFKPHANLAAGPILQSIQVFCGEAELADSGAEARLLHVLDAARLRIVQRTNCVQWLMN